MTTCACGAPVDVKGAKDCRFCYTRAKLMPIIKDWLEAPDCPQDQRAVRLTTREYIAELERRLEAALAAKAENPLDARSRASRSET